MKNKLNIPKGTIYGMLTVIRELSPYVLPSGQKNRAFECKCECGNIKKIRLLHLKRGWSVNDAFDKPIRQGNYK